MVHFVAPESPPGTIAAAVASVCGAAHAAMLSPDPTRAPPYGQQAFSPAAGDPRFSRTTPDALFDRIEKMEPGVVAGSASMWASYVLREKARKRALYSPGRNVLLRKLEEKVVAAEKAADEDRQRELVHVDSPVPAQPLVRVETAVILPPKRARYSRPIKCYQ